MRILFSLFCIILLSKASAQKDSSLWLNPQRFALQSTFSPSSMYDQGKNVLTFQYQIQYNPFHSLLSTGTDFYSTRFGHHSVGLILNNELALQAPYLQTTEFGLKYAYTINIPKSFLGKQVSIIPGIGISRMNSIFHPSQARFADMIDQNIGFVRSTAEGAFINNTSTTVNLVDFSILVRSHNYYFQSIAGRINTPLLSFNSVGQQESPVMHLPKYLMVNAGVQFLAWRSFKWWLTMDLKGTTLDQSFYKPGIMFQIKDKIMFSYKYYNGSSEMTGGYYTKHYRGFIRYQNTPNPYFNYLSYGMLSIGLGFAIGKQ